MKRSTLGALLLILIGAAGVLGWYFLRPKLFESALQRTSDSAKIETTLRVGGDNYLGYWFITAPELRKQAARRGLAVQFTDDGGAYAERLEKFAAREYDAVVLPVNSYLEHGAAVGFPGVIVAAIAESRGADGIVGYGDQFPSGKIEDLNDAELEIVYTGASPSEFLLDLVIADFDLDELESADRWRREVGSSREVYRAARDNEGDVFVLWEPDLSRALALPGMRYVWGSDRFSGYIVDVFVFHRDFLARESAAARDFLEIYFRVQKSYANGRDRMLKEMRKTTDLEKEALEAVLEKIDWLDLEENRRLQFGLRRAADERVEEGIVNTILAVTDVMIRSGRLSDDPLTGNPYLITQSSVLEELAASVAAAPVGRGGGEIDFVRLDEAEWRRLAEIGTFRVEPITFQSWDNRLTDGGKETVDRIAQLLRHNYPDYRVMIRGHTAPGGDEAANEKLSLERAQAVMQYLKAVHDVDPDRLLAQGVGSAEPPRRKPGESPRAYQYRLARVEFRAVEANPL